MASSAEARWLVLGWVRGAPEPVASAPTYEIAYFLMVVAERKGVKARIIPNPDAVVRAVGLERTAEADEFHADMWRQVLNESVKWEA